MPFSPRWFYGDTLFIVDPWLWIVLAIGCVASGARQRHRKLGERPSRPARTALGLIGGYIIVMGVMGWMARRITARELTALTGEPIEALLVAPAPLTPMVRSVVAAQGAVYRTAEFRWLRRPHLDQSSIRRYPRGMPAQPAAALAAKTELGRRFLSWARFPVFELEPASGGGTLVHMIDLRYARRPAGFGAVTILVADTPQDSL
jgi:inner membrane protein